MFANNLSLSETFSIVLAFSQKTKKKKILRRKIKRRPFLGRINKKQEILKMSQAEAINAGVLGK